MCVYGEETDLAVWEVSCKIGQSTYLQWISCAGNEEAPLETHVLDRSKQLKSFWGAGNLILYIRDSEHMVLLLWLLIKISLRASNFAWHSHL